ncbi:MAG TPA: HAD-IIB family hydrolase [Enteractinococcus sp.]
MSTPSLLITDLDGTLAGDGPALQRFKGFLNALPDPPVLVYVTGRHLDSARALIHEDHLPSPQLLVTDVGTAIYDGATLREDATWRQRMQTNWEPEAIRQLVQRIPDISLQPIPESRRVSCTTTDSDSVAALQQALEAANLAHTLIYSAQRYVDILPADSGKGQAVAYLLEAYYPQSRQVLIAGDSGNDTAMLKLGLPAVVVGNAHPELDALAQLPHVHRAQATHAAGIIEGWQHFFGPAIVQQPPDPAAIQENADV